MEGHHQRDQHLLGQWGDVSYFLKQFYFVLAWFALVLHLLPLNFVLQPQCLGIGIFMVPLLLAEILLCQEGMTTHHVMTTTVLKTGKAHRFILIK